jgi:hypothetical protein
MQLKLPLSVRAVSVLRLHQKFQLIEVVCFQCLSVLSDLGWLAPASDYKDVDEIWKALKAMMFRLSLKLGNHQ